MNKKSILFLAALTVILIGCTKFYTQSPYRTFNHEQHVAILFEEKKDCFYCHQLPDANTFLNLKGNFSVKAELKIDNTCHICHKDVPTKMNFAPQNCYVCHDNLKTMKPEDHVSQWVDLHVVPATLNKKDCDSCHSDWYCENCHSKQYTRENYRHPEAFRITHSVEAMMNPDSCDSCHRISFCRDCHRKN